MLKKLLDRLTAAQDPIERNTTALAIVDTYPESKEAAEVLIKLISADTLRGQRGTLLYALEEMNVKVSISLLAHLIETGGYEERQEAWSLLNMLEVEDYEPGGTLWTNSET